MSRLYCEVSCAPNSRLPSGSVTVSTAALRLPSRAREPVIVTVWLLLLYAVLSYLISREEAQERDTAAPEAMVAPVAGVAPKVT